MIIAQSTSKPIPSFDHPLISQPTNQAANSLAPPPAAGQCLRGIFLIKGRLRVPVLKTSQSPSMDDAPVMGHVKPKRLGMNWYGHISQLPNDRNAMRWFISSSALRAFSPNVIRAATKRKLIEQLTCRAKVC